MASLINNKGGVEIGVLEECDSYLLESRYFPNKLGGKPAWLDLKNLPAEFSCGVCTKPCIFLCQVYAPIDDNPKCHHRAIFVFVCPDPACCKTNENNNFKVFRCQLPVKNDFFPVQDPTEEKDWHPECRVEKFSRVCSLCGNPAPFNCGKCRMASYCSKEHQVAHWKLYGHKVNCGTAGKEETQIEVPFLFPEFEITIDKLPEQEILLKSDEERMAEYNGLVEEGKAGTLAGESSHMLEQYTAIKEDKFFNKYKECVNECPEQVLRYDRGGTPIYITKPGEEVIPNCEYCNSERQFEFQILSTMLNEIGGHDVVNGLDWGTLLIYTCKNNCSLGPAYKVEYLLKQDVV